MDSFFLLVIGAFAAAAVLFKENAIMIMPTCLTIEIIRHFKLKRLPFQQLPKIVILRIFILLLMTSIILYCRLRIQEFKSPVFKPEDNFVAASDSFLTRTLSQSYLYCLNLFLLLCPIYLSFDWSFTSIPLVTGFTDYRIVFIAIFYVCLVTVIIAGFNNR